MKPSGTLHRRQLAENLAAAENNRRKAAVGKVLSYYDIHRHRRGISLP